MEQEQLAAAMNPIALNEDGVDAAVIEKEIEIAKDQLDVFNC